MNETNSGPVSEQQAETTGKAPPSARPAVGSGPSRRPSWESWAAAVLGLYFLARLLFFAFQITPGVPPDEPTHVGVIGLWAESPLWIQDSPASHPYGLVTRVPFLYHLLLGKLEALGRALFGFEGLLFLRLLNVALSALTLALAYRLARRLSGDPLVRLLFLLMATNTLMLTFLGAAVSYDNLVNLLAVLALSALWAFLAEGRPEALLGFLLWSVLGGLTKVSFLPLAGILALILVAERRWSLASDLRLLVSSLRRRRPRLVAGAVLVAAGSAANFWLYGGNLLGHGRLVPACDQVLTLEACLEDRIFARGWILRQHRQGAMSFEQAVAATGRIRHPGDREHTLRLLRFEQGYQRTRPEPLPRWNYLHLVWDQALKPTVFGIQGHLSMLKKPRELLPYNLLLMAAFLLWIRSARWRRPERVWSWLGLIALVYFLILVGGYNYRTYLETHAPLLGVQGRYLFPVLVPAYLAMAHSLLSPLRRWLRIALLLVVAAVYIPGDFPYFLRHAGDAWFGAPAGARTEEAAAPGPKGWQGPPGLR